MSRSRTNPTDVGFSPLALVAIVAAGVWWFSKKKDEKTTEEPKDDGKTAVEEVPVEEVPIEAVSIDEVPLEEVPLEEVTVEEVINAEVPLETGISPETVAEPVNVSITEKNKFKQRAASTIKQFVISLLASTGVTPGAFTVKVDSLKARRVKRPVVFASGSQAIAKRLLGRVGVTRYPGVAVNPGDKILSVDFTLTLQQPVDPGFASYLQAFSTSYNEDEVRVVARQKIFLLAPADSSSMDVLLSSGDKILRGKLPRVRSVAETNPSEEVDFMLPLLAGAAITYFLMSRSKTA